MNPDLREYIDSLEEETSQISGERKVKLSALAGFIKKRLNNHKPAKLTFICTHNSRRSQLCQVWAAALSAHFDLEGIKTYSGGTEVTTFNPRAVEAIRRAGFTVKDPGDDNSHYKVYYDENKEPVTCYSKTFDDPANPTRDFAAVMTCSDADRNCPVVPGAEYRVTLPYEDPKQADGTPGEGQIYNERCRQIAAEMYFVFFELV